MEKGDYTINEIYQGGYSSLNPSYGDVFQGYRVGAGSLGLTTDPRSANILKEVSDKLSTGVKAIEVELVSPEVFDSIPKQQLKEVERMSKLTGIDVSVHGPVIDTTGITQQGFSELNREASERKVLQTIERSQELDPKGNISVTFHSAEGLPGTEYKMTDDGKKIARLIAINKETGKMAPLEEEKKFCPGGEIREETYDPKKQMEILNNTEWINSLAQIEFQRKDAEGILRETAPFFREQYKLWATGNLDPKKISSKEYEELKRVHSAAEHMKQAELSANALFNKAYEYGTKKNQEELKKISKEYGEILGLKDGKRTIKSIDPKVVSDAMFHLINELERVQPKMYVPIEEFAVKQSSKTFGNAAFEGWKKFKKNAPIINIENPPVGFALSTGEDLKNLVETSKKQFVKRATQEGSSKQEAKEQAEKLIGVTWDLGHINMLRKQGFKEEDIIKETEKIAPLVKHVHLSDNFGFEHTELPMGMGNVPFKEIMKKLGKKGFEAKKIIEAGNWWQHFRTSPVQETLQAMGSPVYSEGVGPYWNQTIGLQQGYSSGYGQMLPQVHYETFGAGFAQLPTELGGQRAGTGGGRMSGRAME